jgi:NAD+ diphosphatase
MNESGFWILRYKNQILITTARENFAGNIFPYGLAFDFCGNQNVLLAGEWLGLPCYTADIEKIPENQEVEIVTMRRLYGLAGADAFAICGRATQLLDWQKNYQYCGRCGKPTTRKVDQLAMSCSACDLLFYPRIAPAIMVLVLRGDEVLLARSPYFTPGIFSALAGFVEAGETLEQCAIREIHEEVGIAIKNLRYFRSQSWPFPNSLMVAFTADYVSGILTPDPAEIETANWFSRSALPPLPDPMSIARQLIDEVCGST